MSICSHPLRTPFNYTEGLALVSDPFTLVPLCQRECHKSSSSTQKTICTKYDKVAVSSPFVFVLVAAILCETCRNNRYDLSLIR